MEINKISNIDIDVLHKVLTSSYITESQKTQFLENNRTKIQKLIEVNITDIEFLTLMQNRTLQKFRPLKNSYTKFGDKIILAKILGITANEVPNFIKKITQTTANLKFLPQSTQNMIKTYVYRHGTKSELLFFLDLELKETKDIVKSLYSTLSYHSGGVADYFIRPIHRMDNKTLINVYNVINKNITLAKSNNSITELESLKLSKLALLRIYEIQNNSKLINAIKTYKTLK